MLSTPGASGGTQNITVAMDSAQIGSGLKIGNGNHDHNLADTIRGAPNLVLSNDTRAEITDSTDGLTDSFLMDSHLVIMVMELSQ